MSERYINRRIHRQAERNLQATQNEREDIDTTHEGFFGQNLLRTRAAMQQLPVRESFLFRQKTKYESELKSVRERLIELASNFPEEIEQLIKQALSAMPEVELFVEKQLRMNYADDDEFKYLVNKKSSQPERGADSTGSREVIRRQMLIDEVASVMVTQMCDDPEYDAGSLPEDFVIAIIQRHQQAVEPLMRVLEHTLTEMMSEAISDIMSACDRDIIPLSKEEVSSRLTGLRLLVHDDFVSTLAEKWGSFDKAVQTIAISAAVPIEYHKQVIIHELFHALGGQLIVLTTSEKLMMDTWEGQWNDDMITRRHYTKSGLSFDANDDRYYSKPQQRLPRLYWLDEAITEQSTLDTAGVDNSWAYQAERALLRKLVEAGITKKQFYQAAYEDAAMPAESTGATMPQTRDLFKSADKIFYQGFLADLDLVIRELHQKNYRGKDKRNPSAGVDIVNERWKTAPNEFQQWLRAEVSHIKNTFKPKKKKTIRKKPTS